MRLARPLVLSAVALAIAGAAYAERPVIHVAAYALPDGSVAHVRYTGDVAPRLVVVGSPDDAMMPSPFAAFDRIAAMMGAQADAMFGEMAGLQRAAMSAPSEADAGLTPAALATEPAGTRWTSVSSTTDGGHSCTTQVSMVSQGAGKAPSVVRKVTGDCAGKTPAPASPTPPTPPATPTVPQDSI